MTNIIISTEKLNDIQICPLLYYYKHELRQAPIKKAIYFEAGELMHEMLRMYYQGKINKENYTPVAILEHGRNYAASKLQLTSEEVEVVITDARMYFNFYAGAETWEIEGAEEPFAKELYVQGDFRIIAVGKIDLRVMAMGGKGPRILVDHKYEARFDQKPERDNQPLMYCWAFETRDFIYNRIGKQKSKKVDEKLIRPHLSYAPYQIEDWKESAIESANKILQYLKTNSWPMQYHGCNVKGNKCTFYDVCNTTPDNRLYKLESFFKDRDKYSVMGESNEKTSEGTVSSSETIQEES